MTTHNGWTNYETWNIALWIGGDESFYRLATKFMATPRKGALYLDFVKYAKFEGSTPDGVEWLSKELDLTELNAVLQALAN